MESYQTTAPARLGRYELIGKLATGGMAEIHLARLAGEAGFEKVVVVKRLLPELVSSPAYVAMFLDEGKLVARLDHPNICEVYELGRDGSEYFLAMPYLDGVAATELVAQPRDPDRVAQLRIAAAVIAQACAGLHHAHELRDATGAPLSLVHRDVSPSNLFVTAAGIVKVLDFGIAKVRGTAETELGTVKGKSQYMAPEQILGERVDRRCDVFGLGIVLYELATHQRLFRRDSEYLAARAILEEPIPRADASDPAVPAALADVIARALARDREVRFVDARALAVAIEAAMAAHGGVATAAEIAASLALRHADGLSAQRTRQLRLVDEARTQPTADEVGRPPGEGTWRFAAIAGAGVALVAASLFVVRGCGSHAGEPAPERVVANAPPPAGDAAIAIDGPMVATAPVDAAPAPPPIDASPAAPHHPPKPPPPRPPGTLGIDSTPYATIAIDGKPAGITPLLHLSLAAGRHHVHASLRDGRTRDVDVDVPPGRAASPINLTW